MRLLAFLLLLLSACSTIPTEPEPKFSKGEKVYYKVPKFYVKVCNVFYVYSSVWYQSGRVYHIYSKSEGCPDFNPREEELRSAEE